MLDDLPQTTQSPSTILGIVPSPIYSDQFIDMLTGGAVLGVEDQPPGFEMYEPVETGTNG